MREERPQGLVIQMFSVHGLIRGHDLELGRDADTGGQTKYVVEFARALGTRPEVARVDLFTRLLDDPRIDDDYAEPVEELGEGARIVRIRAGGKAYRRKELLWPSLDEFVERVLRFNRREGTRPDVVHGHYADAGYVALQLASTLAVPLVFTGHSLGRNKVDVLRNAGMSEDEIEAQYKISHRIEIEEELLRKADVVIASTKHEVEHGYELYEAHHAANFQVMPPGIPVDVYYPWFYDLDAAYDPGEKVVEARVNMNRELDRFLNEPDKPLVLAISRPDKRKNIDGLVTAFGENKELQALANLAVFAGVRKDIEEMDDNEREVLTRLLLLMDRYDLYGKMALPKKHDSDTDIPVLYRLAAAKRGVFVNPALVENFGITLIEASSSGLPVVSTDHGGPKDIIETLGSGLLVDTRDTRAIQEAITRILVDEETWTAFSHAGIEGVRKHYAWYAHAEAYLDTLDELLRMDPQELTETEWRSDVGRHLQELDRLLVSDIDYTLMSGRDGEDDASALAELAEALREAGVGFGVASGRHLGLVEEAIERHDLPEPQVIVAGVGTEIRYGAKRILDRGYAQHLRYRWKREAVRQALAELPFLEPQPEDRQTEFKLSYYLADESRVDEVRAALEERRLRHTLVWSHGRYLDVLPHRASKGKAVRYLAHKWGLDPKRIAVAGDSGNDAEMLRGNFRAIVVGNHTPDLEHLRGRRGVVFTEANHARGVLEGLRHHGFVE